MHCHGIKEGAKRMETTNSQEQLRQKCRQLYQNPVFLATHEALSHLLQHFDIVELFDHAQSFAQCLIANRVIDRSLMKYEMTFMRQDLYAEGCHDEKCLKDIKKDEKLLLLLTLVILRYHIKAYRHAREENRVSKESMMPGENLATEEDIARKASLALAHFIAREKRSMKLVRSFMDKARQLRKEGRWLLSTQNAMSQEPPATASDLASGHKFVSRLVNNCECLNSEAIEHILLPLMATNEQYGHAFDEEVNRLKEKLGIKTDLAIRPNIQGDFVMQKHVEYEVGNVEPGGTGAIFKNMP